MKTSAVILVPWQAALTHYPLFITMSLYLQPVSASFSEQTRPSAKAVHLQGREANGVKMLLEIAACV